MTAQALENRSRPSSTHAAFWTLTIGAIGVVYGDIGTSPLYAFREAIRAAGGLGDGLALFNVLGVLSLIVWSLVIVVTVKYVLLLLRADNDGEGGILSLLALTHRALGGRVAAVTVLGAIGASLFYGDALITPAISVLSAVEGLDLLAPKLSAYVVPLSIAIIVGLFMVQSKGTGLVSALFGPVTLVWFIALAIGGIANIAGNPQVLLALDPSHAVRFIAANPGIGFITLGAVFLAVTGAEALYADLGHFGHSPIRLAWLGLVFPALVLNYLGQGALVLADPAAADSPFYRLYPEWALAAMVVLATLATIIASQAVITGAYSLTRQAIQLKLLPRLVIRHTSEEQAGQIYMPLVNTLLLAGVLGLVVGFGSSSRLAIAYGIAVTGTMLITTVLALIVIRRQWGWSAGWTAFVAAPLLVVDLTFLGANLMKIMDGGYVPLLIGALVSMLIWTWVRGTALLAFKERKTEVPLEEIIEQIERKPPPSISGTAVFLTAHPDHAPAALLHSLKHFKSLHQTNVILTVLTADVPNVPASERIIVEELGPRFLRVTLTFGFMDEPDVPKALASAHDPAWTFQIMSTSFLVSRRTLKLAASSSMPLWQRRLFILLARNASGATDYFRIPAGRVVEIGTQVGI
ncbi:MAG: potassium transporter Kup [Hyphomicrobiaceae bacterium]